MRKKRRLSENAVGSLSWVRKTEKAEEPKPANNPQEKVEESKPAKKAAKKATAKPRKSKAPSKSEAATESTPSRFVNVEYDKNDGSIIATHEVIGEVENVKGPWTNVPADKETDVIALTGDLFDKDLIDIHMNYKVVISKNKPTLVPKG